jgi:cell division protease FtsH
MFLGREITRTHHHSDETVQRIDEAMQAISRQCYERAEKLLTDNKDKLERLAQALVRYETLNADEVDVVLEGGDLEAYRKTKEASLPPPPPSPEGQGESEKDPNALPGLDRGPAPGIA